MLHLPEKCRRNPTRSTAKVHEALVLVMIIAPEGGRQEGIPNSPRGEGDLGAKEIADRARHQSKDGEQTIQDSVGNVARRGINLSSTSQGGQDIEHSNN